MKMKAWLTALALSLIVLTGCANGSANYQKTKIQVTSSFLEGLIAEQEGVQRDYPYTATVVDDWIVQNEPK